MGSSRKLTLTIASLLLLTPMVSFALGLGPITMRSALNQPLLAEIDVHSVQPGDLQGLKVNLASQEDFARIRVEPHTFLQQLKFQVAFRKDGSAYVKITTTDPVTEPYLDFLVEAKWPRGRALKEYTVLVDPPVLTDDLAPPVAQARTDESAFATEPVKPVQKPRPVSRPRQQVAKARPKPKPAPTIRKNVKPTPPKQVFQPEPEPDFADESGPQGSLNYGVVQRNDTLWEIAEDLKQSSGSSASIHQLMMALLRSNPEAFIDGNVNLVKAGAVLRIDDPEVLEAMSQTEAVREFRQQMTAWRARSKSRLVEQVASADAGGGVEPVQRQSSRAADKSSRKPRIKDEAKLKLVAPGSEGAGSGSGKDSAEMKQLRQDLILATEQLDANSAEGGELNKQVSELNEQLESVQRLIMLKDEELQALQGQLVKNADAKAEDAAKPKPAEKPKPKPAVQPEPAEDEYAFDLMSDTMLLGGAGLLVVGVVVWLVVRRRKMQDGFEESILNVGAGDDLGVASGFAGGASSGLAESALVSDFSMSDMGGIQSDSADVDPISEADVYLAYGRHQQAEDIIKQALETNPERPDLHAKLLEVYHASNNKDGFVVAAEQFHNVIGGDESNEYWSRVSAYGAEICPEHSLFGGTMVPGGDMSMDMDMDMDMSMDMDIGGDTTVAASNNVTSDENDLLDFEFGDDLAAEEPVAAPAEDNSMDFDVDALDFGLGDDDATSTPAAAADDNSLEFDMPSEPTELNLSMDMDSPATAAEADGGLSLSMEESDLLEDTESDTLHAEPLGDDFDLGSDMDLGDADDLSEFEDAFSSDEDLGDDIFGDVDEIGTKLDLAKAYVDMGDSDGARSILDEVMEEGDDTQKQQAEQLLQQMG